jgi:hypothetical protein
LSSLVMYQGEEVKVIEIGTSICKISTQPQYLSVYYDRINPITITPNPNKMTIKQLKEIIKDLPDEMLVYVDERQTQYTYGYVDTVEVQEINLMDENDNITDEDVKVLIISEI